MPLTAVWDNTNQHTSLIFCIYILTAGKTLISGYCIRDVERVVGGSDYGTQRKCKAWLAQTLYHVPQRLGKSLIWNVLCVLWGHGPHNPLLGREHTVGDVHSKKARFPRDVIPYWPSQTPSPIHHPHGPKCWGRVASWLQESSCFLKDPVTILEVEAVLGHIQQRCVFSTSNQATT